MDVRSTTRLEIYAQRLDASGVGRWAPDGVLIANTSASSFASAITSDGLGGAVITWQDYRSGASYDIYAQRVDASGTVLWGAGGVEICGATGNQMRPSITTDGSGGAIIAWEDYRSGSSSDIRIYVQRIDGAGVTSWTADGVLISPPADYYMFNRMVSDGARGAIVAWQDNRSLAGYDIFAQRVNDAGVLQWTVEGVTICSAAGSQWLSDAEPDGMGGAVISWMDERSTVYDVYAQRVSAAGVAQWSADGVAICTAVGSQTQPSVAPDGSGGAIIAWEDPRGGAGADVYAQRANAAGVVEWTADGIPICSAPGEQRSPIALADGSGGAIIAWPDGRGTSSDIYAQRVNAAGGVEWIANGLGVCTAPNDQETPCIVEDEAGGAIIAWMDSRTGWEDVYARRLPADGLRTITASWNVGGQIELLSPEPQARSSFTVGSTDEAVVRIRPEPGYYIAHVTVDGVAVGLPPNLDVGHATSDHALIAGFESGLWSEPWVPTPRQTYTATAFPLSFADNTVRAVLGELGDYDDTRWRLARWDPVGARYRFAGTGLQTLEAGAGYWLITADGVQVQADGTPLTADTVGVGLEGGPSGGWNQIANPFRFPIADTALRVVAGGAPVRFMDAANVYADRLVWEWKGGANYDSVRTLEPRRAYWVRKTVPDPVRLVFPNWTSTIAPGSPALKPPGAEWSVSLVARQGDRASMRVLLGRWDRMATSEPMRLEGPPASPGGGLSLHLTGAGDASARRIADFTSGDGPWTWVLDLKGAESPGEVRLEVEGSDLPPGLRLRVEDEARGWSQEVRPGGTVTIAALGAERHLMLRAGYGADEGNSPVATAGLGGVYPNPFRDRVGLLFRTARLGDVHVAIYDLRGRNIRAIDMLALGAGEHVAVWDGKDTAGHDVPCGVYLARGHAGDLAFAARLVRVR